MLALLPLRLCSSRHKSTSHWLLFSFLSQWQMQQRLDRIRNCRLQRVEIKNHISRWLQAVSELLSQHVLQHYDKFVAGINEVARVEEDLVAAYKTCKA